jgi:outer membrane protein TolC
VEDPLNDYVAYTDERTSQDALVEAEVSRARTYRDQLVSLVRLYKALGGGWSPTANQADAAHEAAGGQPQPGD